jgi:heat shock protein HslJ
MLYAAASGENQVPAQLPPTSSGQTPPAPSGSTPILTQGVWLWIRTEYGDGSVLQSADTTAYSVAFMDDGRVAIRADCNTGVATYTTDGSRLTIDPGPMTLVACPPNSQDTAFLRDLFQVATYVFNAPQLVLTMQLDSGNMIFSQQSVASLTGPTWRVTSYNNGMHAVVSTLPGPEVSMVFSDDARVSGNTGCNLFNGPYTLSGSSISFGPLATTRRVCASDGASQQEQQFLAALNATTTYELRGDRLTFHDSNGSTQIVAVEAAEEPPVP